MKFYLRAISYFHRDWPLILASLVTIGLSTLASLLQPFMFTILSDTILKGSPPDLWVERAFVGLIKLLGIGTDNAMRQVIFLAAVSLLLRLFQEFLGLGQRMLNYQIGYNGLLRVRCDLFRKLQALSLGYHKSQPQGDAIYRLSYDTFGFQTILNVFTNNLLVAGVTLILMAWMMFRLDVGLALITLSVAPALLITTKLFAEPLKKRWLEAKEKETQLTTAIQRSVASIGLVQAFGREGDEFDRFHSIAASSIRANLRQAWRDSWYWLLVGAIFGVGYAAIFLYGGREVIAGTLSVGYFIPFLFFVNQVYAPLYQVSTTGASVQGGVAGAQRVFEVLDREAVIKDAPNAIHLPRKPRVLEMRDVGFEYRPGDSVLSDINIRIEPGKMVAFVGSSGVGKTTLLNLLPRFYDPTHGQILLDGNDIRNVKLRDLRAHVALVLQDNLVLPTTVAENIAYGRPNATAAQIAHAAALAGAADFIQKLPSKYETPVNESGANLSGGQRQRIGIARALLTEAPFIVLDEPTSALDPQNEAMIAKTLQDLKRQRTILIVSHRLSTVLDCDEIFVMHEGKIVENGTHAHLVELHGVYFAMARHQLQLKEPAASA